LRLLLLSLLLAVAGISTAWADPRSFHAGIARIKVQDTTPFDAVIVYPTEGAEVDAPVAAGARFPVVLFSHGGGRGPGTPLVHRDLLLHLARQGFIVIAPFHPASAQPFVDRPRHVHKALDAALADPRFAKHADRDRIGMVGFSFGGAVTLIVAGASIDLAHLSAYCRDHPDDSRACGGIATDGSWAKVPPSKKSDDALPVKALVLLEPYGAVLERKSLGSLDLPILIYAASQSDLRPEGNALALAKALPRLPQQVTVPGSHFVFVDPCSPIMAAQAPDVCRDPPGTDRAAIHQRFRREIADFLRANM
jgi:predicted dienelactone hydrolase